MSGNGVHEDMDRGAIACFDGHGRGSPDRTLVTPLISDRFLTDRN